MVQQPSLEPKEANVKWIAISGSWRKTSQQIEADVRRTVREILARGDGIVTGGALGVDFFATDEALRINPTATHLKIFLPTSFRDYTAHYWRRAAEEVITAQQAEALAEQLERVRQANPRALVENALHTEVNEQTYALRNTRVIKAADELVAFQVNGSAGVQDAIDQAIARGLTVQLNSYAL